MDHKSSREFQLYCDWLIENFEKELSINDECIRQMVKAFEVCVEHGIFHKGIMKYASDVLNYFIGTDKDILSNRTVRTRSAFTLGNSTKNNKLDGNLSEITELIGQISDEFLLPSRESYDAARQKYLELGHKDDDDILTSITKSILEDLKKPYELKKDLETEYGKDNLRGLIEKCALHKATEKFKVAIITAPNHLKK